MAFPPSHARVVVVGGGIVGASTAYHLAKMGVTDVVVLEQGKMTCGTTWHAAGLVGQTRATRNATRMSQYGIELYSTLEQETGLATGWKQCGSLNVAKTPERMQLLKRQMARAKSFGIAFDYVTPAEAQRIAPILRTDDLAGAVWIPGDGKANPTDLTQSLAKGARLRGAAIFEGVKVTGVANRRAAASPASRGNAAMVKARSPARPLVNCGGQWAREFGRLAGVNVPLYRPNTSTSSPRRLPELLPTLPSSRSRRLHLLQGGSRRPRDGRLRAGRQAVEPAAHPGPVRVPVTARGLGSVRGADDQRDPPHAVPRDC
jgi:4-methylaminobutanoate oxidase (formaldehyde-forming)